MGMNIDDFCRCTPDMFNAIYTAYIKKEENRMKDEWERARFEAMYMLTPYSKKKLKVTDLCHFPWDTGGKEPSETKKSSREEYEKVMREWEKIEGNI